MALSSTIDRNHGTYNLNSRQETEVKIALVQLCKDINVPPELITSIPLVVAKSLSAPALTTPDAIFIREDTIKKEPHRIGTFVLHEIMHHVVEDMFAAYNHSSHSINVIDDYVINYLMVEWFGERYSVRTVKTRGIYNARLAKRAIENRKQEYENEDNRVGSKIKICGCAGTVKHPVLSQIAQAIRKNHSFNTGIDNPIYRMEEYDRQTFEGYLPLFRKHLAVYGLPINLDRVVRALWCKRRVMGAKPFDVLGAISDYASPEAKKAKLLDLDELIVAGFVTKCKPEEPPQLTVLLICAYLNSLTFITQKIEHWTIVTHKTLLLRKRELGGAKFCLTAAETQLDRARMLSPYRRKRMGYSISLINQSITHLREKVSKLERELEKYRSNLKFVLTKLFKVEDRKFLNFALAKGRRKKNSPPPPYYIGAPSGDPFIGGVKYTPFDFNQTLAAHRQTRKAITTDLRSAFMYAQASGDRLTRGSALEVALSILLLMVIPSSKQQEAFSKVKNILDDTGTPDSGEKDGDGEGTQNQDGGQDDDNLDDEEGDESPPPPPPSPKPEVGTDMNSSDSLSQTEPGKQRMQGMGAEVVMLRSLRPKDIKLISLIDKLIPDMVSKLERQKKVRPNENATSAATHPSLGSDITLASQLDIGLLGSEELRLLTLAKLADSSLSLSLPRERKRGPVYMSLDASGSMRGTPYALGYAFSVAMATVLERDRRGWLMSTFSVGLDGVGVSSDVRNKLTKAFMHEHLYGAKLLNNVPAILQAMTMPSGGGTDFCTTLYQMIKLRNEVAHPEAEFVLISDGEDHLNEGQIQKLREMSKKGDVFRLIIVRGGKVIPKADKLHELFDSITYVRAESDALLEVGADSL